ncbi:hypothetical protein, partial [Vibrio sp. 10N.261.52.E6]|uniref:hypothetical protein n=1 Tax=Vibrio sp. 10N.261.52.E6 TaxID=3229682 RepID=UPI00354B7BCC
VSSTRHLRFSQCWLKRFAPKSVSSNALQSVEAYIFPIKSNPIKEGQTLLIVDVNRLASIECD